MTHSLNVFFVVFLHRNSFLFLFLGWQQLDSEVVFQKPVMNIDGGQLLPIAPSCGHNKNSYFHICFYVCINSTPHSVEIVLRFKNCFITCLLHYAEDDLFSFSSSSTNCQRRKCTTITDVYGYYKKKQYISISVAWKRKINYVQDIASNGLKSTHAILHFFSAVVMATLVTARYAQNWFV